MRTGLLLAVGLVTGCGFGPRQLESGRVRYNEALKVSGEQQFLLNVVRLRYTDTPSSLAVSGIADQRELAAGLRAVPFFTSAAAGDLGSYRGLVLPQAELTTAARPTLSYTPQDDEQFARRLFTPVTLDGVAYLAKTTWPVSTVFRLYLENLNWVSNAQTGSGPTPKRPPVYADFLAGIQALQRLQDRGAVTFVTKESDDPQGDPVAAGDNPLGAAVEAAKGGLLVRKQGDGFRVVKVKSEPILRIDPAVKASPDFECFCAAFKLDPSKTTFLLTTDKLDPFDAPPAEGLDKLDLETRSLLQVLYFAANGVEVPPEHLTSGVAPLTVGPDGAAFDWRPVVGDLITIKHATGRKPPPCAAVAVRYRDHWFYLDDRDRDSKATFALLLEVSRLELGGNKPSAAPLLTIPVGGR